LLFVLQASANSADCRNDGDNYRRRAKSFHKTEIGIAFNALIEAHFAVVKDYAHIEIERVLYPCGAELFEEGATLAAYFVLT
jgi:hypothetical protein